MFMLECEGQTANTRNQLKVNKKKKYHVQCRKIQNCFIFVCLVERVAQLF